jgi:hypothetical protein
MGIKNFGFRKSDFGIKGSWEYQSYFFDLAVFPIEVNIAVS